MKSNRVTPVLQVTLHLLCEQERVTVSDVDSCVIIIKLPDSIFGTLQCS
jgi:hypothetical protein